MRHVRVMFLLLFMNLITIPESMAQFGGFGFSIRTGTTKTSDERFRDSGLGIEASLEFRSAALPIWAGVGALGGVTPLEQTRPGGGDSGRMKFGALEFLCFLGKTNEGPEPFYITAGVGVYDPGPLVGGYHAGAGFQHLFVREGLTQLDVQGRYTVVKGDSVDSFYTFLVGLKWGP